ncbi:MAG: exodeoxyribonuclease alpha subunit [Burkholderiaceae bacterium]|nr:exodeoxyribonuclease alpha subunit [Burkholderiaceae bacterium]
MKHIPTNASPEQWLASGFAEHLAHWAQEQSASPDVLPLLRDAAREVSLATNDGHVCITLDALPARANTETDGLRQQLLASGVVGTPDAAGAMPLIIDPDGRLYLHRYFDYERRLATRLIAAASGNETPIADLKKRLDELFAANRKHDRADWQKLAAALALQKHLTIISGGPGTGKTTTVVNLLACLLQQNRECRIALAAPTGKAAARMQEAIRLRASHLPQEINLRLPTESFTIHRLLGVTPKDGEFRHHAGNPLAIDALVVDEASMLDLALAAKLFEAVPPHARIILLGDKDQLAAVESGAVFSELGADPTLTKAGIASLAALTGTAPECILPPVPRQPTPLHDSVIWFDENYRFAKDSGIGKLAADINSGQAEAAIRWLRDADDPSVSWLEDGERLPTVATMQRIFDGHATYLDTVRSASGDKQAVFEAFDRFRTLCALREGPRGVNEINLLASQHFRQTLAHRLDPGEQSAWYPGRPIMVLKNDYLLKLFNGDIGIVLPDEAGNLMAYFPDGETGYRAIAPLRLPQHETAFAMTVHKSQGSEFDAVLLLLPSQHNRVVSRELLYTGITRAMQQATIAGSETVLVQTIASPTIRRSGLIRRMEEAAAALVAVDKSKMDTAASM